MNLIKLNQRFELYQVLLNFRDEKTIDLVWIFPFGPRRVEQGRVLQVVNFLDLRRHVACGGNEISLTKKESSLGSQPWLPEPWSVSQMRPALVIMSGFFQETISKERTDNVRRTADSIVARGYDLCHLSFSLLEYILTLQTKAVRSATYRRSDNVAIETAETALSPSGSYLWQNSQSTPLTQVQRC